MPEKKRKRGRPKSKLSVEDFVWRTLIAHFCTSLEMLEFQLDDSDLLTSGSGFRITITKNNAPEFEGLNWRKYEVNVPPQTEAEAIAFSRGLKMAIEIMENVTFPEFLESEIREDGLTLNVSRIIRKRIESDERTDRKLAARSEGAKEAWRAFREDARRHFPLPNEILRKVRKPKVPRSAIVRLRRTIKEHNGLPYLEEIANKCNLTPFDLLQLVQEAGRQGISIEVGELKGKKILIV